MLDINTLFDEQYYLTANPDVAQAMNQGLLPSGLEHFNKFGQFEKRNPSAFFDTLDYLQRYPDVATAVNAEQISTIQHFLSFGQLEKRDPSVFFDTEFYLDFYPDVDEAVSSGQITAIQHFLSFGQFEKRDPIIEFFTDTYLSDNPDVAQAVSGGQTTAMKHYMQFGQFENRDPGPDFNSRFYLGQYPDVAATVRLPVLSAIKHYLTFGKNEGRTGIDLGFFNLNSANDLGTIGTSAVSGFVGDTNTEVLYRFNVNDLSLLSLDLNNLSADADVSLIQDTNNNGLVDETEDFSEIINSSNNEGTAAENLNQLLQPGTYFVAVQQYEGNTNFNLSLVATPFTPPSDTAGNSLATARNLGSISETQTASEFVGDTDKDDFYRINLTTSSLLNVSLDGLSADADLFVIQDSNNNGVVEDSEILAASEFANNNPENIIDLPLAEGDYFIEVKQFEGDTLYNLSLSATPETIPDDAAGNTLSTARDVGTLSESQTFTDFVGDVDQDDIYRFTTTDTTDFSLNVTGLTADADVSLILDRNNNSVLDEDETFEGSSNLGSESENLNINGLPAGTYFVDVYEFEGDTNYTLNLSATPTNTTPITIDDPTVAPPIPPTPPAPTPDLPDTPIIRDTTREPEFSDRLLDPNGNKPLVEGQVQNNGKGKFVTVEKPQDNIRLGALIGGSKWVVPPDGKISFSFVTDRSAGKDEGEVSEAVKNNVLDILKNVYEPVIPIRFVEVNEDTGEKGMLRFMYSRGLEKGVFAAANGPADGDKAGNVYLNPQSAKDFEEGSNSYSYAGLIHEIGHALGLSHPGNYNGSSSGNEGSGPFLPPDEDNDLNSVMTYNSNNNFGEKRPTTLQRYDIQALQALYGVNTGYNSGDNVYPINDNTLQAYKTIWDGGGNDTLDFSSLSDDSNGYRFDLSQGGRNTANSAFEKVKYKANGDNSGKEYKTDAYATAIAYGTIIENLLATSSNDSIKGNNLANFIDAGAGNDQIYGAGGADIIFGRAGADRFTLAPGTGGTTVETAPRIADFNAGEGDEIGLFNGLTFDALIINPGAGNFANAAVIQNRNTGEYLAKLNNTQASVLTQERFTTV